MRVDVILFSFDSTLSFPEVVPVVLVIETPLPPSYSRPRLSIYVRHLRQIACSTTTVLAFIVAGWESGSVGISDRFVPRIMTGRSPSLFPSAEGSETLYHYKHIRGQDYAKDICV